MGAPLLKPSLDGPDYHDWLLDQATHLRARRFDKLDAEAVAEELEDMGRSERRAVESHLKNLLLHLLKWAAQPQRRSRSWRDSIDTARDALTDLFEDSPSLRAQLTEFIERQYPRARRSAANQTGLDEANFPPACPFLEHQVLAYDFLPEKLKE